MPIRKRLLGLAAAVTKTSDQPVSAQALITFLQSPYATQELRTAGFTPVDLDRLER